MLKRWKATVSIYSWQRKRVGSSMPLLVDYEPGRSLDIWFKNKKQHVLALSSPDPLRGIITSRCFVAKARELQILQTALARFVRFTIWSCCERLNTLKEESNQSRTIESFVTYLSSGMKINKRGKGVELQFCLGQVESMLLASVLQPEECGKFRDHETTLIQQLNRRRWGINGAD